MISNLISINGFTDSHGNPQQPHPTVTIKTISLQPNFTTASDGYVSDTSQSQYPTDGDNVADWLAILYPTHMPTQWQYSIKAET